MKIVEPFRSVDDIVSVNEKVIPTRTFNNIATQIKMSCFCHQLSNYDRFVFETLYNYNETALTKEFF